MFSNKDYIIDININRFKEGARVLEDIARFVIGDFSLFTAIKDLKHSVNIFSSSLNHRLITTKNIGGSDFIEHSCRDNIFDLVNANAKRMQESARVLEELVCEQRHHFKTIRFQSYELHSKLLSELKLFYNVQKLSGLYVICDGDHHDIHYMASIINESSVTICQLRMKNSQKNTIAKSTEKFRSLLNSDKLLIINDHLDIALAVADGVHLGQNDIPLYLTKKIASNNFIIGITCHNNFELIEALRYSPSYISIGCIFKTTTKKDIIYTSLEDLNNLLNNSQISGLPISVIGGINQNNINELINKKIRMYAISSAIWNTDDPLQSIKNLTELVKAQ